MNKKMFLVVLGAVVLIIVGFVVYSPSSNSPATSVNDKQMEEAGGSDSSGQNALNGSSYIEYESGVVEANADSKRVLYFYANWCPTCRPVNTEFQQKEDEIPEGVVVIRVNYNDSNTDKEEEALATKYGVTYQHTFVQIDSSGNALRTWNGGGLTELKQNII